MHPNLDPEFATRLLRPAGPNDNKYTRGSVGFVTGSLKYPGAALLGINAAFELSVGMVQYLGPDRVADLVLSNRPEVVLGIEKSKVLVVGSGITIDSVDQQENVQLAVASALPIVIDAGALDLVDFSTVQLGILTPHATEAERLFARLGHTRHRKDIEGNPVASAQELADLTGQVVLLKGSMTVLAVTGDAPIESGPGSPHLAQAGTGDVLAGMIGALAAKLIANGYELTKSSLRDVALVANQLHSEAAEIAAGKGEFGASAVCAAISETIRS